jgi:hypothetical protein
MRVNLGAEDLAKGTLVAPTWYPCKLGGYKEEKAKTDGSTNAVMQYTILTGEFKGAGGILRFNEKAMGFAKNLLLALGAKLIDDGAGGKKLSAELSEATINGKMVDIYIKRGESNKGNAFNEAADYAPIGKETGYKTAAA